MKLASVIIQGKSTFGLVEGDEFVDLGSAIEGCPDLRSLLARGALQQARQAAAGAPRHALSTVAFAPTIPDAGARMFALGWSYGDHMAETGKAPPEKRFLFSKHPQSLVGHGQPIVRPAVSERFDYEGEIAIVIGKAGRHIAAEDAMQHIAGYTLMMDGSVRDWQQHSVTAGKNFDRSSAYGPWLTTADEIADPGEIMLTTRLNGEIMQQDQFSSMVWGLGALVAYVSTITELQPGDSISTGTPAGVGHKRKPPVFMKPGDFLEVEATVLGTLANRVIEEDGRQGLFT